MRTRALLEIRKELEANNDASAILRANGDEYGGAFSEPQSKRAE
jgi:hypothetical protein